MDRIRHQPPASCSSSRRHGSWPLANGTQTVCQGARGRCLAAAVTGCSPPAPLASPWQGPQGSPSWSWQSRGGTACHREPHARSGARSGPLARLGTGRCRSGGCRSAASMHVIPSMRWLTAALSLQSACHCYITGPDARTCHKRMAALSPAPQHTTSSCRPPDVLLCLQEGCVGSSDLGQTSTTQCCCA